MRAFKQFLSLVLVTCMLTSMFTIVSAAGPQVYARTWDSDSGHITIQQGSGTKVDSGYVKYADSNYVKVELDENKTVEVDLTSGKEDVTVTLTGENLAGSFDLKVLDSGDNLVYVPEQASEVTENTPAADESDNQKITFEVPPISMAGGSTLAVYPAGSDALAWEISYKTRVKGSLTTGENTPAEIPTVSEEGSTSVTVPAAAVKAVLDKVEAAEAYVSVSAPAKGGSLLLDTSVFNNSKFNNPSFALHIKVEGKDDASYTWIFTKSNTRNRALLSDSPVDLNVTVDKEATFGKEDSISGTSVEVNSNMIPADMSAELTVETNLTDSVKVFYRDGSQKWVEDRANANLTVKDEKVTFQVRSDASNYAIVASKVTEGEMNPTTEPETTYSVEVVKPKGDLSLSKDKPTDSIEIQVVDENDTVLDSGKYKVDWESNDKTVATVVKDSGYKGKGAQGEVTAHANGSATVTATVTLNEDVGTLPTNSVSVNVTVTGFDTTPDPAYAITITPDKATIKVGETTTLKAVVTEDGKTLSDAAVTWTTSDSKVATVNNGTVTAVAKGTADITASYAYADGKSCTAKAVITVTEDEVPEITIKLDPTVRFVYIGRAPVTLTATVTGTDEKAVFTTEDNGLILLTDKGDNTATVKGLKAGDTTVTATVGGKTATCKILVRVYHGGGSGGGSSSSGGGGSWNDGSHGSSMPSAGSGTTTTPGTGTTTPGTGTSGNAQPQGCVSDTVGNFSVKGSYQYKLTSTNGQAPAVTVSNSNFRVVLASQNGKDYFFKVYAIGAVGQTCDVLVNGTKVSTVTASEVYGGVSCDTTAPFTVKKGGSYQFKLTASSKPVMAAGSSSFRVEYVGNSGNDWFFKVYAVGNAGDGCGFYVNGAPFTVAVAHIGE